ncbi:AraC-like DNA-binding protein [Rhizobium leguminosarum]|uniref:AraC-like DNA-binding protein n=2 Tax=Rhizobium/Agrobacterium group TaxID=227290 RepID=A0AAE2MSI5_RHILE|nr:MULTISPECIES: AraC family transcriptional regulator [Rhizobium]MBB4294124.1 AraC-like DNA-binding protein [Rhizobium leguminosarum]MBB4300983.1 AraC-like DNA-binding protein [Rhizobium leguminosarum]MBB4311844.1 AraC-like DNA-binding protein [Rhizobium leguminosarum]MBB4420878.1 AraC-like DNA-binding protein [Rhizobium leguminosarum]MBB4436052.1 AraC-like DNA-binding protein [Rhizobium esperanzae]
MPIHAGDTLGNKAMPPISKVAFSGTDVDQLSEILSTPRSPISVTTLDKSPVAFRCSFLSAGAVSVADCSYEGTFVAKREAPGEKIDIFLPMQGNAVFNYPGKPIESTPARAAIFEGESDNGALLIGPRRHLALFIDKPKVLSLLSHMLDRTIRGKINIDPYIDLTSNSGLALMHLAEQLHRGLDENGALRRSPLALASLCDAVTYLILENCQHGYSDALAQSVPSPVPRHVKRAIDFMHEHIAEPISLAEIAVATNVSIRTLQQGFRQFRNTTPMSHLRELRLAAVHCDLLDSRLKSSISDVAAKWGFTHLGRFAAEYKKRFGHLPSEALKA